MNQLSYSYVLCLFTLFVSYCGGFYLPETVIMDTKNKNETLIYNIDIQIAKIQKSYEKIKMVDNINNVDMTMFKLNNGHVSIRDNYQIELYYLNNITIPAEIYMRPNKLFGYVNKYAGVLNLIDLNGDVLSLCSPCCDDNKYVAHTYYNFFTDNRIMPLICYWYWK